MKPFNITIKVDEDFLKDLDLDNLFKTLKLKGLEFENKVNESIQESISNEKIIELSSHSLPLITNFITKIKENQELLFELMNIPTKDDIASTAKLIIETQEKIDALEEQNWQLIELNKQLLGTNSADHMRVARSEEERLIIEDTLLQISKLIKVVNKNEE